MNCKKIILCLLGLAGMFYSGSAQEKGKVTRLGPQVFKATIQGSAFTTDRGGKEVVFTVLRGLPARFVGFNVETGEKIVDADLTGADGAWDVAVSTDGIVYAAGANGVLYSHTPGQEGISNLGKPIDSERLIWDLTAGENGVIYGGTYPGCRVFRYHPSEGAMDITGAPLAGEENYARSVEYYAAGKQLFVGVGSHAHMVVWDLVKKQGKQILPAEDQHEEFVYDMKVVPGLKGGDRVFASLTGADPANKKTMVYNIRTGKFEKPLPVLSIKEILKSKNGQEVYYFASGNLFVLDYNEENPVPKKLHVFRESAKAVTWDKDGKLTVLTSSLKVMKYNVTENKFTSISLTVPKLPITIQSIYYGPDKRVWSGGYLAGGHAAYDLTTGTVTPYDGLHQTEGMASMGKDLYFGIYNSALLYRFDTTLPWDLKKGNPKLLGKVPGQDRPFAVLPLEDLGMVLFGTIPAYGQLGGSIAQYSANNDKVSYHHQVVHDQSVSSLTRVGGRVFGATTVFGGLGGAPSQKEAVIFEWDPVKAQKVFQTAPIPGNFAITGLMEGPDGNLWGFGDGTLFVYNVKDKKLIRTVKFYELTAKPTHIWRNAFMLIHPNGRVYISARGKLYSLNPSDFSYDEVAEGVDLLTKDDNGNLYFKRGADLFKYEPPRR